MAAKSDPQLIERWQRLSFLLPAVAAGLAMGLSTVMKVSWDLRSCLTAVMMVIPPLCLGVLLTRLRKFPALAGILTIFGLTLSLMMIGAALALLGTRSPAPVADWWLAAADRALPLSGMDIVRLTNEAPAWIIELLRKVYVQTGLYLLITLIALEFLARGDVAWRMFLVWGSSFLVIALLAFSAPALGCYSQLSDSDVAQLPGGAGRYAVKSFMDFRYAAEPLLSLGQASGVITFPSFHTVCALLIAQAWHGVRIVGAATKLLTAIIIFSCVPMGGHYVIDLAAGAAVWLAVTLVVDRLGKSLAANSIEAPIMTAVA
jgi:hypothetical protein